MTQNVLITGAAGGIGGATARRLIEMGWEVHAGVRAESDIDRLPAGVHPIVLDVTDQEQIEAAAKYLTARTGRHGLGGLVNNAGLIVQGPLELVPLEAWRRQFEINVLGQVAVTQAMLPLLRRARGRLVNVGAVSGRPSLPFGAPIASSKGAFALISDALRMELRAQGIKVALVEPGAMDTDIFRKAAESGRADGFRGSLETQQVYAAVLEKVQKAFESPNTGPVEPAVKAIVKALTARRPKVRYVAGRDARMFAIVARLPAKLRHGLMLRALGVGG
jgi:NAD(P)-dependent dehydrogenase (short-subunit alcohol dehydrogenase family)